MAKIRVEQSHGRSADEARAALEPFESDLTKYGLSTNWRGLRAELKGTGASGEIVVDDNKVVIQIKLGMLAKAAGIKADKVEASIRKRLEKALA